MSRTHKSRSTFKIDSLLGEKLKTKTVSSNCFGNNMTIMFQGYFDRCTSTASPNANNTAQVNNLNNNNNNHQPMKTNAKIRVEVLLLKIAQKKRKDSSSTSVKQIGVVEIPQNPPEHSWEANDAKFPTISLNTALLDPSDSACTQIVCFRTQSTTKDEQNYSSELMMFDKMGKCLLTDGEYQLSLQESIPVATVTPPPPTTTNNSSAPKNGVNTSNSPKKYSSWENLSVFHSDSSGFEDQFEKTPIIKFQLHWTEQSYNGNYQRLSEIKQEPIAVDEQNDDNSKPQQQTKDSKTLLKKKPSSLKNVAHSMSTHEIFGIPSSDLRIAFHFVHNNVSHQTTEQTNSMDCPWCSLNCLSLYSLLKHLKLCHARFAFNFVHSSGSTSARIEVSINELFDGSYAGAPNNYLTSPSAGYAFSRSGPVRRTTSTHVQVCRPRRMKPSLAEFTETDEALEMNGTAGCGAGGIDRPYLTGHNRLYHHTMTCLPVHPRELDVDSEEESDPRWLKQKTMMMIDEFTDVNEGEKELMKMWNLHVMRHGFVGDCQTALACEMFVEMHGKEVLAKNLYRNFVVHMCSLFDYGLVSSEAFHRAVQKLQRSLNESKEAKGVIYEARGKHREHWNEVGYVKFVEKQKVEQEEADRLAKEKEERERREKEKVDKCGTAMVVLVPAAPGAQGKRKVTGTSGSSIKDAKTGEEGSSKATTTATRSRELFQKPKGGQEPLSNGSKKKAGTSGAKPAPTNINLTAENPNKRKLERGE